MELSQQTESIKLDTNEDDVPTIGIMGIAEQGGAFDWLADEEDLYSVKDLKLRYELDL